MSIITQAANPFAARLNSGEGPGYGGLLRAPGCESIVQEQESYNPLQATVLNHLGHKALPASP